MIEKIAQVLQRIVKENRPRLQAFDGPQFSCLDGLPLNACEPSDSRQETYTGMSAHLVTFHSDRSETSVPVMLCTILASEIRPANLVRAGAVLLSGAARLPAWCCTRARQLKKCATIFRVYWTI